MIVMSGTRSALPTDRPLTVDDLDLLPDDGNRYELDDGMLAVSPAPALIHQLVASRLQTLLDNSWIPPAADKPSLTAFELRRGAYREVAEVSGGEVFGARRPFAVEIVPSALVAGPWQT
jgi:hypothetical protein